jgi:hypothetical protein
VSYTPDLKNFVCRMGLHNWEYKFGEGNRYFECKNCPKRKVETASQTYQPINFAWLRDGKSETKT